MLTDDGTEILIIIVQKYSSDEDSYAVIRDDDASPPRSCTKRGHPRGYHRLVRQAKRPARHAPHHEDIIIIVRSHAGLERQN
jgi:hypothetical protein